MWSFRSNQKKKQKKKRFFNVNNMSDQFENVNKDYILFFLREIKLYQKI